MGITRPPWELASQEESKLLVSSEATAVCPNGLKNPTTSRTLRLATTNSSITWHPTLKESSLRRLVSRLSSQTQLFVNAFACSSLRTERKLQPSSLMTVA